MKKNLVALLVLVCSVCCALWLAACGNNGDKVVEVTEITLDVTVLTLTEGGEETITATVAPANATDKTILWTSSDDSVATVLNGKISAIAEGEATITASSKNGKKATCYLTVEADQGYGATRYVVTFYANGGEFEDGEETYVIDVEDGEKLESVTPTREGNYTFTGWYKNEILTELWDFDTDTINESTSLYAGWRYTNGYQSVIEALTEKIKAERQIDNSEVEILSVFTLEDCLCFIEKDETGVYTFKTDICGFEIIKENEEVIAEIPDSSLEIINNYNYFYTSDDYPITAEIVGKFTYYYDESTQESTVYSVIYSCITAWEEDNEHITSGGTYYSCKVKALIADNNGRVYDYSVTVVAGADNFEAVLGGSVLSEAFDVTMTALGEVADDFYSECLKQQEA